MIGRSLMRGMIREGAIPAYVLNGEIMCSKEMFEDKEEEKENANT